MCATWNGLYSLGSAVGPVISSIAAPRLGFARTCVALVGLDAIAGLGLCLVALRWSRADPADVEAAGAATAGAEAAGAGLTARLLPRTVRARAGALPGSPRHRAEVACSPCHRAAMGAVAEEARGGGSARSSAADSEASSFRFTLLAPATAPTAPPPAPAPAGRRGPWLDQHIAE